MEKTKNKGKKTHEYYDIKDGKISRKLRKCPRCGSFMALHQQPIARWSCGACSYTEYVTSEEAKN
jgi:small subunit ribosomal protein S27Ae